MKEMMHIMSDWTKVSDLEKCVNDLTVLVFKLSPCCENRILSSFG
jgi:hypothetical protein